MNTETPTPLEIPDAALDAAGRATADYGNEHGALPTGRAATALIVHAAAPHLVAFELRRLAEEMARRITGDSQNGRPYREAYAVAVAALRVRASELSPEENR